MTSNALVVNEFIDNIENKILAFKIREILKWIKDNYPDFNLEYKWNQPMFVKKGTYIMGFSVSKKHISVGLEALVMEHFKSRLDDLGIEHGKMIFKIKENEAVNYDLFKVIIDFIIEFKKEDVTFWHRG